MRDGWWRDPTDMGLWRGFLEPGEELVAVLPGLGGFDVMWLIVRREGALAAVLLGGPWGGADVALTALFGQPALKTRIPWSVRRVRDALRGSRGRWETRRSCASTSALS
jgi:hypothetical protein